MHERFHILVVEDDPPVGETLVYALETEGFRVVWHQTGTQGLEAVRQEDPALVVLDVGLPDMDGFEFCRRLRADSGVPILFLTARSSEVDRVVGLELGGDDYVTKPFSPREVTARIKAILRRTGAASPERDGGAGAEALLPFRIDRVRHRFLFHEQPLDLSGTEFRILEVLVDRPGQVFTRGQLLDRAWDEPEASMERTVDAHIKSIRAKLHRVNAPDGTIRTVRGVGYALREHW